MRDRLPINGAFGDKVVAIRAENDQVLNGVQTPVFYRLDVVDRKSTRLNSSHALISYAVFCLKKKKKKKKKHKKEQKKKKKELHD